MCTMNMSLDVRLYQTTNTLLQVTRTSELDLLLAWQDYGSRCDKPWDRVRTGPSFYPPSSRILNNCVHLLLCSYTRDNTWKIVEKKLVMTRCCKVMLDENVICQLYVTLTSHHQECFPFLDGNNKYGSHDHSHHRAAAYLRCPHYDKTGNSAIQINSSFKNRVCFYHVANIIARHCYLSIIFIKSNDKFNDMIQLIFS